MIRRILPALADRGLPLAVVADQLATAVGAQWQAEAERQRRCDPHPLPVVWDCASADLVEPWDELVSAAQGLPGGPEVDLAGWVAGLGGADHDLTGILARVPTGRLVVLGEPGSGKTTLLIRLVLDLLATRAPGGPVPVLVPLAGWDPAGKDLPTWLTERLILDHDGLAGRAPAPARAVNRARALLDQGLLLPILDGLDELPEAVWGRAVARLNDWLPPGQKLVLACRTAAYRQAITPADPATPDTPVADAAAATPETSAPATLDTDPASGTPGWVRGAAGIVLRPLTPEAVRAYLCRDAGSPAAAARWDPVLATLGTGAPAAQALTSPLLVGLARTVYNPRPGESTDLLPDPAELCDTTRLPTPEAVEAHLLDAFIPAAYRPHPDPAQRGAWTAERAERWLSFLAHHLHHNRDGTTDIAWWHLRHAVPSSIRTLLTVLVTAQATAGMGVLALGLAASGGGGTVVSVLVNGLVVGLVSVLAGGFEDDVTPARGLRWSKDGERWVALGGVSCLVGGLIGGIVIGLVVGLSFAFVGGLAGGHFGRLLQGAGEVIPATGLWWWRGQGGSWLAIGGVGWLFGGLVVGAVVGGAVTGAASGAAVSGVVGGLVGGAVGLFTAPAGLPIAVDPRSLLARDRRAYLTVGLGVASWLVVLGVLMGPNQGGLVVGLVVGSLGALSFWLAFSLSGAAWGRFAIARCSLATGRRLPWRLMTFLADAHQHGVLRQAGTVYQFHHIELQRRLATRPH